MPAVVFCDFEFQSDTRRVLVGAFLDGASMERTTIDFRTPLGAEALRQYVAARPDHTWAAYAAQAEMSCFLWLGLDIRPMRWIDLMAELHMVCGTTSAFFLRRPSLLGHMKVLDISHVPLRVGEGQTPEQHKDFMRALILGQLSWTEEEWADICDYCWSDVLPLVDLLDWLNVFHDACGTRAAGVWDGDIAALRGEYLKASANLEHRSRGIPVHVEWLRDIFRHRTAIRNALAERCNAQYGHEIYRQKKKVVSIDPLTRVRRYETTYSFNYAGLEAYLKAQPFYDDWERTNAGRRKLEDSYLDDLIKAFPILVEFKQTRNTLAQLNNDGLVALERDGHIRPESIAFYTRTGRNQPMAARGFLFNLPPWLRSVIRPQPGMALIQLDWSKQEIGIAVALSGDEKLRDAFMASDIYFELARLAGAVPQDAVDPKDPRFKSARQAYKSCQLGLGYGMGVLGLSRSLYADLNAGHDTQQITREQATDKAREIYRWHKQTFPVYWQYLERQAREAREEGWANSFDGWLYFVDAETRHTQLLNVPMQTNGASMLRWTVMRMAETEIYVVCTLHDAIYVQCREEDVEATTAVVRAMMEEAAEIIIGPKVRLGVEATVYTHDRPYRDARGAATLSLIEHLVAQEKVRAFSTPTTPSLLNTHPCVAA
ncbi:DNA polymerase, partial [Falsiroseomonas sp. E2-1-a20]|uniref:DNA polymerase n=1 Tax=Falsiroseomonas sp. E2-1-a20 TaxID=3239300 RepID=UPI003F2EEE42